ncbi:MAG TPA: hypothetical protein VE420_11570, partial [Gemmatimonadales bacterium]|nr:hypothetical protein [Gemmatimonadales bacterium]
MFVTIRRYSPQNGAINKASLEVLRRQLRDEFLPSLRKISGFTGYYVLNVGDRELVTLSLCESKEGSAESSRCSAEYTFRNPLVYELGRPEVIEGEVLTSSHSASETTVKPTNGTGAAEAALALWFQESRRMLLA